jgi:hypothetical protein
VLPGQVRSDLDVTGSSISVEQQPSVCTDVCGGKHGQSVDDDDEEEEERKEKKRKEKDKRGIPSSICMCAHLPNSNLTGQWDHCPVKVFPATSFGLGNYTSCRSGGGMEPFDRDKNVCKNQVRTSSCS